VREFIKNDRICREIKQRSGIPWGETRGRGKLGGSLVFWQGTLRCRHSAYIYVRQVARVVT
jgi:hypothetical protein